MCDLTNMSEQSKEADSELTKEVIEDLSGPSPSNDESEEDESVPSLTDGSSVASSSVKKKKSRKAKLKKILGGSSNDPQTEGSQGSQNPPGKLTPGMVEQLLEMNPSLKGEVAGMSNEKAAEALKKLDPADLFTGMVWSLSQYLVISMKLTWYSSPSRGRTKRTWPPTNSGKPNPFHDSVSLLISGRPLAEYEQMRLHKPSRVRSRSSIPPRCPKNQGRYMMGLNGLRWT